MQMMIAYLYHIKHMCGHSLNMLPQNMQAFAQSFARIHSSALGISVN